MITKNDCLLLLTELQDKGEEVDKYINQLMTESNISLDIIKYLNTQRQFDLSNFYEGLRYKYNHKQSTLYKNIVREEYNNPEDVVVTLSALGTQILLYDKKASNKNLFLSHSRFEEITKVLNNYATTYDLRPCLKLIYLIKSDLKLFEELK